MAADYRHIGGRKNRLGRHYSRFSAFLARGAPCRSMTCPTKIPERRVRIGEVRGSGPQTRAACERRLTPTQKDLCGAFAAHTGPSMQFQRLARWERRKPSERLKSTHLRPSGPRQRLVVFAQESGHSRPTFGHAGGPADVSSSSSAFASFRSAVSKPSVNQL